MNLQSGDFKSEYSHKWGIKYGKLELTAENMDYVYFSWLKENGLKLYWKEF